MFNEAISLDQIPAVDVARILGTVLCLAALGGTGLKSGTLHGCHVDSQQAVRGSTRWREPESELWAPAYARMSRNDYRYRFGTSATESYTGDDFQMHAPICRLVRGGLDIE